MHKFKLAAVAVSLMFAASAYADGGSSGSGKPSTPAVPAFVPTTYTYNFSENVVGHLTNFASLTINNTSATSSLYKLTLDNNFGSLFDTTTPTFIGYTKSGKGEDAVKTPIFQDTLILGYVSAVDINYNGTKAPNVSISAVAGGVNKVTDTTQNLPAPFDLSYILGNTKHIGLANQLTSGESVSWTSTIAAAHSTGKGEDHTGAVTSTPFKIDGISLVINGRSYAGAIPAVPEPETYGMMLMGLGLMGFMAFRRRNEQD